MYHILVVDDEAKIREIIKKYAVFDPRRRWREQHPAG